MEWMALIRRWLLGPDLAVVAEQLALQIRPEVWRRVEHRAAALRLAEARGYVRVKAAPIVRRAVDQATEPRGNLSAAGRADLEHLVTEAVLRQAVVDLINARRLADERPAPLRKAA